MNEAAEVGRSYMITLWLKRAAASFEKTSEQLVTDLSMSTEQAEKLNALLTHRHEELAWLLTNLSSDKAANPIESYHRVIALLRHKGLRDDLVDLLSSSQLATFDAMETNREREAIQAITQRDIAAITEVVAITDTQRQQLLQIISETAPAKLEQDADSRAFMSLTYGEMAAQMDPSDAKRLASLLNADLFEVHDFAFGSTEEFEWLQKQKSERIENAL
jgi:hypothetical protein